MVKKLILNFLMVLGSITLCFSQDIFPKKILWNNDTIVGITKDQLILVNRAINAGETCKKENTLLHREIVITDSILIAQKKLSTKKDTVLQSLLDKNIICETRIVSLEKEVETERLKQIRIAAKWGTGGVILGVLLKWFILK